MSINTEAFFALLRAGLWEKRVRFSPSDIIDFKEVLRIVEEQSVVGLVAAGIEHVEDFRVPQADVLTIAGKALQIEPQNIAMNKFVAELFTKLQAENINALLVKGQGIAQCYEKPLWRVCGDVDLLLDEENYEKAKELLIPLADHVEGEDKKAKHQGLTIKGFSVELHGRMPFAMSSRVDDVVDDVIKDSLLDGGTRIWLNDDAEIHLPKADNDIIIVFIHLLHHFFIEGVGLRQICDWCRLLWTYRNEIDRNLLEKRLYEMGLMSEWKVFASLTVNTLGMLVEAMPFYDKGKYDKKAQRVLKRVLKTGNFGHNKNTSYRTNKSKMVINGITFGRRICDFATLIPVFPLDAFGFFVIYIIGHLRNSRCKSISIKSKI